MKKRVSTAIVILGICSIFLYAKNAGERYTAEALEVQEDIPEKEREPEAEKYTRMSGKWNM